MPKILVGKAMLEIKDPKKREAVIKKRLNGCVSKRITSELLREISAFDEIEAFFRNVRKIYDGVISKA